MGIMVYLFSLADLIFTMSLHPSYWLVRGKPPLNLLLIWKVKKKNLESVVACNQLNAHRYECSVCSGENVIYFFKPW